jgi:tetratricopeptide (TPR) repeat protein
MKSLLFLVVTLVACGGTQEKDASEPVAPSGGGGGAAPTKPTASGDVSFEVPVIEIKGVVYEPEALGRPGMPLVEAKKKTTIDKQRATVASTKDVVVKQAQAAILATMLYLDSKTNKANEKALLTDARQVIRDVAQQAGDKAVDEITLRLLGSYELLFDDYPAAEKAWGQLIEKDPKNKETPYNRAYLVYAQLKQWKNAEALASANADKLDVAQPELAYVTAWAKWRTGDGAGAWQALSVAIKGWGQNGNRDELERDLFLFAARTPASFDDARAAIAILAKGNKMAEYEMLAKLGAIGYGFAGRCGDAITSLDKALEAAGAQAPASQRIVIRYSEADYAVCIDKPDEAAAFAKQAIEALNSCGSKCTEKEKADAVGRIYNMGRLLHNLYATANDKRFYQPAHDVYALTIPLMMDANARNEAQKVSDILEKTLKNAKAGSGTHDKGTLSALLNRHGFEVQSCYEAVLVANPKLAGGLTLNLESDASGVIKGVATERKAGAADLSAVAGCVAERARSWRLPKRGMAGTTRIKMTFALAKK